MPKYNVFETRFIEWESLEATPTRVDKSSHSPPMLPVMGDDFVRQLHLGMPAGQV